MRNRGMRRCSQADGVIATYTCIGEAYPVLVGGHLAPRQSAFDRCCHSGGEFRGPDLVLCLPVQTFRPLRGGQLAAERDALRVEDNEEKGEVRGANPGAA